MPLHYSHSFLLKWVAVAYDTLIRFDAIKSLSLGSISNDYLLAAFVVKLPDYMAI